MTKKLIHLTVVGIKCDTPDCGYHDPTANYSEYPAYVNKPCPNCGGNLLTEKDMATCKKIHGFINWVNKYFGWLGSESPSEDSKQIKIEMNGTGKVDLIDMDTGDKL